MTPAHWKWSESADAEVTGETTGTMPKHRSFSRSIGLTLAGNGAISAIGLVSGTLAARLLGPTGRGELAAIQMWGLFLTSFALLGMPDALVYFAARDPARSASYSASAVTLALLGGMPLLCLAYFAMPLLLSAQNAQVVSEARLYLLVGITAMLGQVPLNAIRGRSDFLLWNSLRVIGTILGLLPLVLAWLLHRCTSEFVATLNLIFWGVLYNLIILLLIPFRLPGPYQPNFRDWKPMLSFGLPCVVTVLPQTLNLRLDQMLMAAILVPQTLGLYVVSVAWAGIMTPLFQSVSIVLFPHIASNSSRTEQAVVLGRIVRLGVPFAVCLAGLMALITPLAVPLIFGVRFQASVASAVVLVVAGAVLGINQLLEEGLRGLGAPKAVMWSEFAGLILTFLLLAFLLKPMGIMGAALASLLGYSAVAIQLFYWTHILIGCSISSLLFPSVSEALDILGEMRLRLKNFGRAIAS
jgi:O-antigen/teichoic acid export membrane protein